MTENAKKLQEYYASRPAFSGPVTKQALGITKAERRAAKSKLVKKAGQA